MPNKKGKKKNGSIGGATVIGGQGFNSTKKNFPALKKMPDPKKSYVSPYSIKAIQKP